MTSLDTTRSISLPGLEAGPEPSTSRDGPAPNQPGPSRARASRSRLRGSDEGSPTSGTSGPLFDTLSPSFDLQSSLESRLRLVLDVDGSPEYALRWKHWGMRSGLPICALRARARPIYVNVCGLWRSVRDGGLRLLVAGWQTPKASDGLFHSPRTSGRPMEKSTHLQTQASLAGWATPVAGSDGGLQADPEAALARLESGRRNLDDMVVLAGWNTPTGQDTMSKRYTRDEGDPARPRPTNFGLLVGRPSPKGSTGGAWEPPHGTGINLEAAARLTGWGSPTATDYKDGDPPTGDRRSQLKFQVHGISASSCGAEATKPAVLSPEHSRWLMGFPAGWSSYADTETP